MKTWKVLGYLGLIPFIVCLYLSSEVVFLGVSTKQTFVAYSAVILSFIAGTIWRRGVSTHHDKRNIISNIFSLTAFACLLIAQKVALIILALSFILLFFYENSIGKQDKKPTNYMNMRFWLTQIVVLLHITAYMLWYG
jgi:chromate transport protein ChrA